MALLKALAKRLPAFGLVLFLVTLFSALLLSMVPGDPVDILIPIPDEGDSEQAQVVRERKDELRSDLGLDKSLPERYVNWLGGFVTGDFGSYYGVSEDRPVSDRLTNALPVSLQLMVYSQLLALAIAIPLGVLTAYRAGTLFDRAANIGTFGLLAIPGFVLGLALAYYIGTVLNWLPANNFVYFVDDPAEHIRHMILPCTALAAGQVAIYMRLLRSDMVATLQEDFVQMARSKGISDQRVLWRHALRPSSITLLTVAGLNVGTLISTALVVEVVFGIPGLGQAIFEAIEGKQYVAFQTFVAVVAIIYVLANLIVDILYTVLDPRIRHARTN